MSRELRRRLLIVEDDPGLQGQMRWCFDDDVEIAVADDAASAVTEFRRIDPQVVTLDLGLPPDPGGSAVGFEILDELLRLNPDVKVIVVTGREETEHAVSAIGAGAHDFYQKPLEADTLKFVVDRAFRLHELEQENTRLLQSHGGENPLDGVIASSDMMLKICRMTEKVASADVTVLVSGETGTGKELFARAIHDLSARSAKPFVAINCAAIPENLLESELFGYEKGAFTGATSQKIGKVETANGGTLFLDEIGDMPAPLQAKMLRFLQDRRVERVGGRTPIDVDVRVVCATHRDLQSMIASGDFREDLYYRISEITLTVPPLRDRQGDAVLIARSLLQKLARDGSQSVPRLGRDAIAAIEQHGWPGNVRELENRLRRAAILADGPAISADDLELEVDDSDEDELNLRRVREQAEVAAIRRALARTGENVAEASRHLGVTRPTLYGLMDKYGIERAGNS